ncbi:MAG: hypothetical protein AB8G05_06315 [Oligoflexales bacterium]
MDTSLEIGRILGLAFHSNYFAIIECDYFGNIGCKVCLPMNRKNFETPQLKFILGFLQKERVRITVIENDNSYLFRQLHAFLVGSKVDFIVISTEGWKSYYCFNRSKNTQRSESKKILLEAEKRSNGKRMFPDQPFLPRRSCVALGKGFLLINYILVKGFKKGTGEA